MSDLQAIAQSLSRTCVDAARYAGDLETQAARLRALAAELASIVTGSTAPPVGPMIAALEEAARACAACGGHLHETDRRGRAYISQLVGGGRGTGGGRRAGAPASKVRYGPAPFTQRADQSEWWPVNDDLREAFDHIFSGHLTFRPDGTVSLTGKHANADFDTAVTAQPPDGTAPDSPAVARRVSLPAGELLDSRGIEEVVKGGISSLFPTAWSKEQTEAAVREAWSAPDGTREFRQSRDLIGGYWTGTGGGLRIEGYFDLVTGRCTSAWPVTR